MRLVNADVLLDKLKKYNDPTAKFENDYLWGMQQRLETCIELVKDAPTVDAVPVRHGRWLWRNYPGYQYQCDQCERWAMYESKFCPECGALMKWWEDGEHEQDKKS